MLDIVLVGCHGRMSQHLISVCPGSGIQITAGIDHRNRPSAHFPVYQAPTPEIPRCDIFADFSRPEALDATLDFCTAHNIPILLGTTGYTTSQREKIDNAATLIPIFQAPNLSLGATVMLRLAACAAALMSHGFDCTIVERHHKNKADSPSGTALSLNETLHGLAEIFSIRSGMTAGNHTVTFAGKSEILELSHRADTLDVYAEGALKALHFLSNIKCPGLYGMNHLLS